VPDVYSWCKKSKENNTKEYNNVLTYQCESLEREMERGREKNREGWKDEINKQNQP